MRIPKKEFIGIFALLLSAFFFYISMAAISVAKTEVQLAPSFFLFARCLLGIVTVVPFIVAKRISLTPKENKFLFLRVVANFIAVYTGYKCVSLVSASVGNILNMTYPIFVVILTAIFFKEQRDRFQYALCFLAFVGIYLIINPDFSTLNQHAFWGVISGAAGGVSVISLNITRQKNSVELVVFYVFLFGSIFSLVLFPEEIFAPSYIEFYHLFYSASAAVLGNALLTFGFRYVSAVEGSIISSTRILLAALLGPFFAAEPSLGLVGWVGAVIIFTTNALLAYSKKTKKYLVA